MYGNINFLLQQNSPQQYTWFSQQAYPDMVKRNVREWPGTVKKHTVIFSLLSVLELTIAVHLRLDLYCSVHL